MITKKLLPFQNVVASGVASCQVPLGDTYTRFVLKLGGTTFTKAMIARIVGKINGKPFIDISGSQLDTINKFRKIYDAAGFLTIDLTEPGAKTVGGQLAGSVGTAQGVANFILEVTIAGATAPTLEVYAMVTEPMPLGRVLALISQQSTFAATGKNPVLLPYSPGASHLIKRVHFFGGSISALEVKKNGVAIFEDVDTATNDYINQEFGHAPQASHWCWNPIVTRDLARVVNLATAQSLQLAPTIGATGAVTIVGEYLAFINEL